MPPAAQTVEPTMLPETVVRHDYLAEIPITQHTNQWDHRPDEPRELEMLLREIWAEVLDIDDDEIQPDSNFFDLGGDSIAAGELVMLASQHGLHLTRQMVFREPVFRRLTQLASDLSASQQAIAAAVPAPFSLVSEEDMTLAREQCSFTKDEATAAIQDMYPATALQAGLMARSIRQPGVYSTSWVFRLQNHGLLPAPDSLIQILNRVAERLPILRTTLTPSAEHGFVQVVLNRPPEVEVIRETQPAEDLDGSALRPTMGPGTPLVKIHVVLHDGQSRGLSVIWHSHHSVYDMTTLMHVSRHIQDVFSGTEALPTPPSFASFVHYSLQVRRCAEWRDYWANQLRDAPRPRFPPARQLGFETRKKLREAPEEASVGTHHCTDSLFTANLEYRRGAGKTSFTHANVFIAAWAYLLACYENSDDVVFGVTNGGRYSPVPGCAEMVAPTIATIPMRVRLREVDTPGVPAADETIAGYLQRVSMLAVEASTWEQVGLSLIQDLSADARRACGFRTLVNIQADDAAHGGGHEASQTLLLEPADPGHVEPLDYALVLEMSSRQGDLATLRLSYDGRVLTNGQVTQIATQLQEVLDILLSSQNATLEVTARNMTGRVEAGNQRYAAVACGVPRESIREVFPCTAAQNDALAASLQHDKVGMERRVFEVGDKVTAERAMDAFGALARETPAFRSRFIPADDTWPPKRFSSVITDEPPLWIHDRVTMNQYLESDYSKALRLGDPATRLGAIRSDEGRILYVVLTAHRAALELSDARVEALLRILEGATLESKTLLEVVVDHPSPEQPASRRKEEKEEEGKKEEAAAQDSSKAFWARKTRGSIGQSFPRIPGGHVPLTSASITREVVLPRDSGHLGSGPSQALLQTAWALTLSQYCDSNDVVFGLRLPGSGSASPIVPQRITLPDLQMSVAEVLGQVEEQTLDMTRHMGIGYIDIIKATTSSTHAAANLSNALIINSAAQGQTLTDTNRAESAFQVRQNDDDGSTLSVYSLGLVAVVWLVSEDDTMHLKARVHFDPHVLPRQQTERFTAHYAHVVAQLAEAAAAQPLEHQPCLDSVNHIPPAHLDEILSWNKSTLAPLERLVHEMVEEKTDSQPEAPAICARDGEWTFSELDQASERLARWLRRLGVCPGSFVPLLFEKCGLAIVAMLGILKAGGASVALDPSDPPERLRILVGAFGNNCPVVLSSAENRDLGVGLQAGGRVVALDALLLNTLSRQPNAALRMSQDLSLGDKPVPTSHAFVLFTSGSTGKPKGILIPHQSFASSIRGHSRVLRFTTGAGSRNFQFTAYTSDVSIGEIFTSLAVGSCVCVPSAWDRQNNLAGSMRELGVNWAFFTPSVATLLGPSEVPSLRTLVFGGETASPENFQAWASSLCLINSFGPAECSIWTHCIPRPVEPGDLGSNIGYGVGCDTWIVDPDDYHRLRPIGAVGEMLVEGPNLAEGYLNDAVKTAEAFVLDPIWKPASRKGESMRLYRTGDLARYLPCGMVQFLGRRDHQVKLNGLRVELSETEHQIRRFMVGEKGTEGESDMLVAVDVVRPRGAEAPASLGMLAAFLAPKSQTGREAKKTSAITDLLARDTHPRHAARLRGLEGGLASVLPSHMVPAAYIPLTEMPLTASAKTDRTVLKRLAAMLSVEELVGLGSGTAGDGLDDRNRVPETVMERVMSRLWTATLGRPTGANVCGNFFKLGGDSLSAMRLVSLARREGIALSVEQVLRSPVLKDMAEAASFLADDAHQAPPGGQGKGERSVGAALAPFDILGQDTEVRKSAIAAASRQAHVKEADVKDIYPCTPLQEGLLALSQDGGGRYVAQMVYKLPPSTDLGRLETAWEAVIQEWPILRSRFFEWQRPGGMSRLMQAVVANQKVRWRRSRRLADYLKLDRRDSMQLGDWMMRLATVHGSGDGEEHRLVVTMHHAIYDGWMLGLLLESVQSAYAGRGLRRLTPFSSFIARLENRDAEESRVFWQRHVGDAPKLAWPALPGMGFRPRSSATCQAAVPLPGGGRSSYTPTTWMRAALGILLGAYSDSDDVVFASTLYGRAVDLGQGSGETVAGPTLATVPVRVRFPREMQVRHVLSTIQRDAASVSEHEQEGMQNMRGLNGEALATVDSQVLLVVQADRDDVVLGGAGEGKGEIRGLAELTLVPETDATTLADGFLSSALVIEATVSSDNLRLTATFDERVVSAQGAKRFLRQLSHLARQLCQVDDGRVEGHDDSLRVGGLDMVPHEDAEEMDGWNASVPSPADALVHELVEETAQQLPEAEALVSWEGSLSYGRLVQIADRLAAHLYSHCGLRRGAHVLLVFEKSIWTVVAMLAVLKAGAAFAAVDPTRGAETLRDLAASINADLVVCSEKYRPVAPRMGLPTFCVGPSRACADDSVSLLLDGRNGATTEVTPDCTAFFLFTSGSTGRPKAVAIDHGAFCSSMRGHGETLCYRRGGRNLQFTAYLSDVSLGEIFTSLTRGGTVCVPSDEERMDDLAGAMERMRVDWAFLTPSVASLLDPGHVPSLKTLVFGGETATVANVRTWAPRLHLINSFGPAETSIWSHAHPHFAPDDDGSDVGWALGCATWIVDPNNHTRRLPIGAVGELMVEGPNVAAGYYKSPAKTQAAFLTGAQLPWLPAERGASRVYRMGDLARWMDHGRVQFLGRRDAQVKLHGLKVQVGEVENAIRAALDVDDDDGVAVTVAEVAVELVRSPGPADKAHLVAFISCTPADQPQDRHRPAVCTDEETLAAFAARTAGLRGRLSSRLVASAIPSFFVPLTAMPLSASAKTDRKRLRLLAGDPDVFARLARFSLVPHREERRPPTSHEETVLHGIWCTVLAVDPRELGVEADFFDCGGDSVAAMKMTSLGRAAGFGLSVQLIHAHPRLRDLAAHLASQGGADPEQTAAASPPPFSLLSPLPAGQHISDIVSEAAETCGVAPGDVADIYPCTPAQRSMIKRTMARPGAWWLHTVLDVPAGADLSRLKEAWHRVVGSFDILRTRLVVHAGLHVQAVLDTSCGGELEDVDRDDLELEAFLGQDMAELRRLPRLQGQPLVRGSLLNKRHLVLTLHHSAYDVWSLDTVFGLLDELYTTPDLIRSSTTSHGQRAPFKLFTKAILLQDRDRAAELLTASLLGVETRPLTRPLAPGADISSNSLLRHRIEIPKMHSRPSTKHVTVTPAEMAHAAIALGLHRQLRTPDTVLRLVSTGRTTPNVPYITELVGPTVATVPVRIHHRDDDSLGEYLTLVRTQLRRAAELEHFGFDDTVSLLKGHPGGMQAGQACLAAPLVVVHPTDPYREQTIGIAAASGSGSGLRRRQLSPFTDDGAPFTLDVSLDTERGSLLALEVRIVFDNRVVEEGHLRQLIVDLHLIVQRMAAGESGLVQTAALLRGIDGDCEPTRDQLASTVHLTRKEECGI